MPVTKFLLDTHCLMWLQENSPKLSEALKSEIKSPTNLVYFSQISLFEIAIKRKIGKLPLFLASIDEIYQLAIHNGFQFIPIKNAHIKQYQEIPFFEKHRDPFDRLLIATAKEENLNIISDDKNFELYSALVNIHW